jgi:hypothetical protein
VRQSTLHFVVAMPPSSVESESFLSSLAHRPDPASESARPIWILVLALVVAVASSSAALLAM